MLEKLAIKYAKKPQVIFDWAIKCLDEFDRVNCQGRRDISICDTPKIREAVSLFLRARAAYQDMIDSIEHKKLGKFERDLREFYSIVTNWNFGCFQFCESTARDLLPKETPASRIKELIEKDPFWMTTQIKADLITLINKGKDKANA